MERTFTLTDDQVVYIVVEDLKEAHQMLPYNELNGKLGKSIRQVLKYYMNSVDYRMWREETLNFKATGHKDTLF